MILHLSAIFFVSFPLWFSPTIQSNFRKEEHRLPFIALLKKIQFCCFPVLLKFNFSGLLCLKILHNIVENAGLLI